MFSTSFKSDPEYIKKEKLTFTFSLFQIPALFLDYFFRKRVNSLQQFFSQIPESKLQFPASKMKQFDKTDVSLPLFEFQQIYSAFCSRNGYVEIPQIESSAKDTLKSFGLTVEQNEGKLEPAYVNLKFKSLKEKAEADAVDVETMSVVNQFLHSECLFS